MEGLDRSFQKKKRTYTKKLRLPVRISNKMNIIANHVVITAYHWGDIYNEKLDKTSSLRKVAIIPQNNTNKIIKFFKIAQLLGRQIVWCSLRII